MEYKIYYVYVTTYRNFDISVTKIIKRVINKCKLKKEYIRKKCNHVCHERAAPA